MAAQYQQASLNQLLSRNNGNQQIKNSGNIYDEMRNNYFSNNKGNQRATPEAKPPIRE